MGVLCWMDGWVEGGKEAQERIQIQHGCCSGGLEGKVSTQVSE
jgi:hypothetical protein